MYFFVQCFFRCSLLSTLLTSLPLYSTVIAAPSGVQGRIDQDFQAGNLSGLHAAITWHRGEIISENYFVGDDEIWGNPIGTVKHSATTLHDLRSVTKSITGLLYGIALEEGKVPAVEDMLAKQFPEYVKLSADKQRQKITIHHTLSMQMGLEWDESWPYTDPRNSEIAMERALDRYWFVLSRPIIEEPGKRWVYGGGSTAVIARLIEKGTGKSLSEYADEKLFKPLGISRFEWTTGEDGAIIAASGLRLSAEDLLKIGQLILNGGIYKNEQVISSSWLRLSFTPYVDVPYGLRYGYFWYISPENSSSEWVAGFGNGGQRLLVDKKNQLIQVVFTGNYDKPNAWQMPIRLMNEFVMPEIFSSS